MERKERLIDNLSMRSNELGEIDVEDENEAGTCKLIIGETKIKGKKAFRILERSGSAEACRRTIRKVKAALKTGV